MSRLLAWLGALLLLPLCAGLLVVALALEDRPLVAGGDEISAAAIARARDILRRNDPRRLAPNTTREVRVAGADLETLLNFAARRGIRGSASLDLRQAGADVRYTATLPRLLADLGVGRFLNVDARLGTSDGQLQVEQVRIGRIPVPGPLFEALLAQYIRHTDLAPEIALLRKTVARVAIAPAELTLTYVWQPELLDSARKLAIGPAEQQRLAAAQQQFVAAIGRTAPGSRKLALADVLGPLLQQAGAQAGADRGQAYRDVLLVTALHLSGRNIAALIPDAARWPRPRPVTLTLRERGDLAQHFVISAAIAAHAGEPLAKAIGLEKEIDDAQRGSGFSFVDLAADRAGTRLGQLAARSPERLAAAVAAGLTDAALLPSIDGLPEHMMADEFRRRFGSPEAPAYRQMSDEIDRRIAALALFR
ncbi:hypothetical protein [Zoogloea sp.]|uniref:hypothetical protein n=1 Tax=Zoogloea sp. TaxID=49181 RepID=UPI0035B0A693